MIKDLYRKMQISPSAYAKELRACEDFSDNAFFMTTIQYALQFKDKEELAVFMDVSIPTIERWSQGKSSPHTRMRQTIYKGLADLIEKI